MVIGQFTGLSLTVSATDTTDSDVSSATADQSGSDRTSDNTDIALTEDPAYVMTVTIDGTATQYTDFADGWNIAVAATSSTVKLLADWTAISNGLADTSYSTSFGTGVGFGDGVSKNFGYIRVPGGVDVTLDLNGHNIDRALTSPTGNKKENAGCVIYNFGSLTITDSSTTNVAEQGKITGGYNSNTYPSGGGIIASGSCSLNINGGNITGNKAINWGGAIYVNSGSIIKMTGGKIYDNIANYDKDSKNDGGAGGIFTVGTVIITGGEISENYTYGLTNGGGIYIGGACPITVGGTAIIKDNYAGVTDLSPNGHKENIYLVSGNTITCSTDSPLASGAHIGITTQYKPNGTIPVAITGVNTADYSGYFDSDDSTYQIYNDETNKVLLRLIPPPAFDLRDGSAILNEKPTETLKWGDNDAKDNYTFAGWYDGIDGTGNLLGTEAAGTDGITYYAKWTKTFGEGAASVTNTVRTTALDLSAGTDASNTDEGWAFEVNAGDPTPTP